ncbi:heterokaryon incompatibility protein-domain-containing protein [Xylaria digitata]|nr:heterokaryon incompatibility protein-domain-containing protein [Xylaria digitata]
MDEMYRHLSVRKKPQSSDLSIRLLSIPAEPKENPRGILYQLSVYSLDSCPEYYALSYCWGFTVTERIHCNEVEIPVTVNLFSALQNLCCPEKGMLIWVDAICINQADMAERTEQVGIMQHIYSKASEVLIWLGPAADESDLCIRTCQNLALEMAEFIRQQTNNDNKEPDDAVARIRTELSLSEDSLEYDVAVDATTRQNWRNRKKLFTEFVPTRLNERQVQAFLAVVSRPWWNRIWIVQELCLARRARVIVGQSSMEWKAFVRAVDVASYHHPASLGLARSAFSILIDLKDDWDWARYGETEFGRSTPESNSLLPLLARLRWNQATDARDKVYGLLGLANDGDAVSAKYEITAEEVYQNAALAIIQKTGSLDVLAYCLKPRLSKPSKLRLPSWVPDWSYDRTHLPRSRDTLCMDAKTLQMRKYRKLGYGLEGHRYRAAPRLTCGNVLMLNGVVLDCVVTLAPEISWTLFGPHPTIQAAQLHDNTRPLRPPHTNPPLLETIRDLIIYAPRLALDLLKSYYHYGAMFDVLLGCFELVRGAWAEGSMLGQVEMLINIMNWEALPEHQIKSAASRLCRQIRCVYDNPFFHLTRWFRFHLMFPFWYHVTLGISVYLAILVDTYMLLVMVNLGGNADEGVFHMMAKSLEFDFRLILNLLTGIIDYRLARTATGHIALVPYCTRIGDRIALLKGGRSPFVIRQKEMRWEIVGVCLVHKMANSQWWEYGPNLFAEVEFV